MLNINTYQKAREWVLKGKGRSFTVKFNNFQDEFKEKLFCYSTNVKYKGQFGYGFFIMNDDEKFLTDKEMISILKKEYEQYEKEEVKDNE